MGDNKAPAKPGWRDREAVAAEPLPTPVAPTDAEVAAILHDEEQTKRQAPDNASPGEASGS